jgi:DNA repair protein RecN (Recombination protein N)
MICANLNKSDIPLTVVFDEIDAGIGGITGHGIGQKLAALATHHQVLCVTHLAQVAQQAKHHFYISKTNAQAVWQVASLSNADRKAELARMIGGKATLDELL